METISLHIRNYNFIHTRGQGVQMLKRPTMINSKMAAAGDLKGIITDISISNLPRVKKQMHVHVSWVVPVFFLETKKNNETQKKQVVQADCDDLGRIELN